MNLKMKSAFSVSSKGSREIQEDHGLVQVDRGIFALADGFGGGDSGFNAAKQSVESAFSFLMKEAGDHDATLPFVLKDYYSLAGNIVFNSVLFANNRCHRNNREKASNQKGGASLLVGYLDDQLLALANAGRNAL